MQLSIKPKPNSVKLFIVHQLEVTDVHTLFGDIKKYKWKKVSCLCLTNSEARYRMNILEKSDKFVGAINTYKIVCIHI